MSCICGIVDFARQSVGLNEVEQMLNRMAHRAPDGFAVWESDQISLGFGLLKTGPVGDARVVERGNLTITCDARLDNAAELIELTGIEAGSSVQAIILALYKLQGRDAPNSMLGDFAFAIWDAENQTLFCARDHFGVKPFYYSHRGSQLIFASEPNAISQAETFPQELDQRYIADYLIGLHVDREATIFKELRRLPARHSLSMSSSGLSTVQYWELPKIELSSSEDLPRQFLDVFGAAVLSRTSDSKHVGAMLSGGIDSSSIACIARMQRACKNDSVKTYSNIFEAPDLSERKYIEAVLALGNLEATFVQVDIPSALSDLAPTLAEQQQPFMGAGLTTMRELYRSAARNGTKILLDGHGGDEVVSHGFARLGELAKAARWFDLWRESVGAAAIYGTQPSKVFLSHAIQHGWPRRLYRYLIRLRHRLSRSAKATNRVPQWAQFVNAELIHEVGLIDRARAGGDMPEAASSDETLAHAWQVKSGLAQYAFEVLDLAAGAAGVEARYPFWDKRVVEFCLSVPSSEKLSGGWTRLILRKAMEGVLPPSIQWRKDKIDFSSHFYASFVRERDMLDRLYGNDSLSSKYVNVLALQASHKQLKAQGTALEASTMQALWRSAVLGVWLEQHYPNEAAEGAAVTR